MQDICKPRDKLVYIKTLVEERGWMERRQDGSQKIVGNFLKSSRFCGKYYKTPPISLHSQ